MVRMLHQLLRLGILLQTASGAIYIHDQVFLDVLTDIGPGLPPSGLLVSRLIPMEQLTSDPTGCSTSVNASAVLRTLNETWAALMRQGECSIVDSIMLAQSLGASAVIVGSDRLHEPQKVSGRSPDADEVTIPSTLVSMNAYHQLRTIQIGSVLLTRTIPASTVVKMVMIALVCPLAYLLFKTLSGWYYRARLHTHRHRLILAGIQSMSTRVYSLVKSDTVACCICLEDLQDGDAIRALKCQHQFHMACIETWLWKGGTSCPMCKTECIPATPPSDTCINLIDLCVERQCFWDN